jgi:hypothetical protein
VTDEALTLTRRAREYVDIICSQFYLPEHVSQAFQRFATEDELAQAALLGAAAAASSSVAADAWQPRAPSLLAS